MSRAFVNGVDDEERILAVGDRKILPALRPDLHDGYRCLLAIGGGEARA